MKEFFRTMFACLLAILLAAGGMMIFVLILFGALAAAGDKQPALHKDSVLVFDLTANIADSPPPGTPEEMIAELVGQGEPRRLQLRRVIDTIDSAAGDDRIKALFLHGSFQPANYGTGYAALLEVRRAIERFRDSGKPVIAYLMVPSTRDFFLATAANRIVMHPMGELVMSGLSADILYWGGAFEKYGIGIQIARAGVYKSAGESLAQSQMSPEEREQLTELLNDVWGEIVAGTAQSRHVPVEQLQALIDREALISADSAKAAGLIDEIADMSAMLDELKKLTGQENGDRPFHQIALPAYANLRDPPSPIAKSGPQVAVVYAEGEIVDGEGNPSTVGGDRFARELRKVRDDEDVKAVVLRVNSPGGSALASEVIRRELLHVREKKPLVVSMGTVAASGGYWISANSDRIFAEPTTITGSIGVFALIPNFQGLANKLALNFESIKTGRNADLFTIARPRDAEAMGILQTLVDDTYGRFLDLVSEGRKMERDSVDAVAQGRVWSGADAVEKGLVDELGGLEQAIKHAAKLAQLDKYSVVDHPRARTFVEELLQRFQERGSPITQSRGPAAELGRYLAEGARRLSIFNDPRGVYALLPVSIDIN